MAKRTRQLLDRKKKLFKRRKICRFCADSSLTIDYKEVSVLKPFVTERGKIIPSRITGNCRKHQRRLTVEIKRCRNLALLPFAPAKIKFAGVHG